MGSSKLKLEAIFPSCTESDLDQLEARLESELPADYREFLLNYNGANFSSVFASFPVRKHEGAFGIVSELFGISFEKPYWDEAQQRNVNSEDVILCQRLLRFWECVPDRYLAIGGVGCYHQLVCLSCAGDDQGSVYVWYADIMEDEFVPKTDSLHLVAETFFDFINSLRIATDEEMDDYTGQLWLVE